MAKTVQEVIETIIAAIPGAPFPETVDTLKTGNPHRVVTSIVTTFLPSYQVIEQAIQFGANPIINHEPTFYNHVDGSTGSRDDQVFETKRRIINSIVDNPACTQFIF
jgi:putative NIF3 family GTP cyclohydrolase 1 type 2